MPSRGTRRWCIAVAVGALLLPACSSGAARGPGRETPCGRGVAAELRSRLLEGEVGVGVADYPGFPVADIPKATAAILMGELVCARADEDYDLATADAAAESLLAWPETHQADRFGWGLPFAWDAFGDGTTNPAATVYSISTAVAVKALLDWAAISDEASRQRVYEAVDAALVEWTDDDVTTASGQLAYSLSADDHDYNVFNSSAMLAGQMQRFAALDVSPQADTYRAVADRVMQSLIDLHQTDPAGNWYWNYSTTEAIANDLTHAGYIIDGVATYGSEGGSLAASLPLERLVDHLDMFRSDGSIPEAMLSWPIWRSIDLTRPQWRQLRLYEEGWTLYTISQYRDQLADLIEPLCGISRRHRDDEGVFHKYPVDADIGGLPNPEVYEYVAYYYLGLVSIGDGQCD